MRAPSVPGRMPCSAEKGSAAGGKATAVGLTPGSESALHPHFTRCGLGLLNPQEGLPRREDHGERDDVCEGPRREETRPGHEGWRWPCSGEDSSREEIGRKTQGTAEEVAQEKRRAKRSVPVRDVLVGEAGGTGIEAGGRTGTRKAGRGRALSVKGARGERQGHRLPSQPPAASPTREHS